MSAKVNPTSDEGNSQGLSSETAPKTPKSASAEGRSADDATKPNTAVEATAPVDRRKATFIMNPGGSAEKKYYFAPLLFGVLSIDHPVRQFAVKAITNKWFDRIILVLIVVNSVIMAMADYDHITDEYEPTAKGSWRNAIAEETEIYFVVGFGLEMVFKVVGMGFYWEHYPVDDQIETTKPPDTYLRDYWNVLDFIVVITGFASLIPGLPNVSAIRTFRVLRPLKSVAGLDGVKMVLVAVTESIPALMSVIALLAFVFAIFGILGLQFFLGKYHSRCRLTPYPVTTSWVQGLDYRDYACLDPDKGDLMRRNLNKQEGTKRDSDWYSPKPCYWPLDVDDDRLCSFNVPDAGMHKCWNGDDFEKYIQPFNPGKVETWCGSNWDAFGNPRFKRPGEKLDIYGEDHEGNGMEYGAVQLRWSANYGTDGEGSFQFGLIDFDNFARAFLTIFQVITLEGWTDIMYVLMDAYDPWLTGIFFCFLVLFGSFFVLNLLLAVLEQNYNEQEQMMTDRENAKKAEKERLLQEKRKLALGLLEGADDQHEMDNIFGSDEFVPITVLPYWKQVIMASKSNGEPLEWRQKLKVLVEDESTWYSFGNIITFCIILNTVTLACDHHPMDSSFEENLEILNFIFTIIFIIEMVLKLPGLGPRLYFSDYFNIFDFIIVISSIVELIVGPPSFFPGSDKGGGGGGISALRSFRLFRIFKLAAKWKAMRQLLDLIVVTAIQMGNFMLLFFLFLYIYALLGMQFFAGRMRFDDFGYPVDIKDKEDWLNAEIPRSNFDTITWATTTIFGILSGENWNANMYDGMRAAGWGAVFYFVTLIVFGMFIVMNIFMAILLANFDELTVKNEDEDGGGEEEGKEGEEGEERNMRSVIRDIARHGPAQELAEALHLSSTEPKEPKAKKSIPLSMDDEDGIRAKCRWIVTRKLFDNAILTCIFVSSITLAIDSPLNNPYSTTARFLFVCDYVMTVIFTIEMVLKIIGLGLLGHDEAYLKNGWNQLDGVIVIVGWIGLYGDSRMAAFKALRALRALKPLRLINRRPGLQVVVGTMISSVGAIANVAIVTILVFVIFSIMAVNYLKGRFYHCTGDNFDSLSEDMLTFLEDPKPWEDMSMQEKSWFWPGSNVTGTDFSGCAHSAADDLPCCKLEPPADLTFSVRSNEKGATSQQVCECWGADWDRSIYQRFDNTWVALGAFYEISTTEGWIDVMLAAVDATDIDMQPVENNNEGWILFFIIFMIVGSFLMTNLFVGVIIQNFNDLKAEKDKEQAIANAGDTSELLMTEDQRMWAMTQRLLAKMIESNMAKPMEPDNKIRKFCFQVCQHPTFDPAIMGFIIANTFVMSMNYFGMDDDFRTALEVLNFIFAMVFNIECVIKLLALKEKYFYDKIGSRRVMNNWNIFDFVVVFGTNLGMITSPPFQGNAGGGGSGVAMVIRMFRIGRLLRLVKNYPDLRKIFNALILALPGLVNVAAVVFLLFFIFSVIGMQLFATVAYHESLGPHANFRSFGTAFLTLFRFCTGENFNGFMYEASHAPYTGWYDTMAGLQSDGENPRAPNDSGEGFCDPDVLYNDKFLGGPWDGVEYGKVMCGFVENSRTSIYATQSDGCVELNGCSSWIIFPFLKLFTLIVTFVFLNLFVGIILDSFDEATDNACATVIDDDDFHRIWQHWKAYDPEETYCINIHNIKQFLQTLEKPFGFGLEYIATDAQLVKMVKDLNLHVNSDGKIHFFKVLKGLSRRQLISKKAVDGGAGTSDAVALEAARQANDKALLLSPEQEWRINRQYSHIPNMHHTNNMTADVAKEAEGEDLSHILARMAIRKAFRKHMYAKKFGDAVKDVMKDHNLSINLEASQQQPPVVPEQELEERDSAAENGPHEGGNVSVGKEATL